MSEMKSELARFNDEFAKLKDMFQQALGALRGEPEYAMAKELTDGVSAKHQEWSQAVVPAMDWLEQEQSTLQQELAKTQMQIEEVEKQLQEALAEAEKPIPTPPPAPPALVPGEGDPRYGFTLGAELLALLGTGAPGGQAAPEAGDVWQLDSVDWKVDSGEQPVAPPQPKPEPPAAAEPNQPKKAYGESIGQSIDWTE